MTIDYATYYQPKPKQAEAHRNRAKYLLMGGAIGGGKSWWLCSEAIRNAMQFKGNRLVIVRKETSVIKRTILITFFQLCPPEIISKFNQSSLTVEFINGSVLYFIEANISKDLQLNKLKGLEIGWFGIDEANEVSIEVFRVLKSRLRWMLPDGTKPRYEGRLTSNPENCWLIPEFIQSTDPEQQYVKAITTDNYDPESEYFKTLEQAFKDSPSLLQRYLYGDWTAIDSVAQLIPSEAILKAIEPVNGYGTGLGVDVARYGDDRTVYCLIIDGNIKILESYLKTSINEVVTRTVQLIKDYNLEPDQVGIDGVGIGAGVIDNLRAMGLEVMELIGGAKPDKPEEGDPAQPEAFQPFNLRAEMYWKLRREMLAGEIGGLTDETLKHELSLIQYEIQSDKTVKIIPKEIIKKLNGKSPDFADALCYANYVRIDRGWNYGGFPISAGK